MTADANRAPAAESVRARFAICMLAGAVAGFVLSAFMILLNFFIIYWHSQRSLADHLNVWRSSEVGEEFFMVLFVNGPVSGVIGGLITALFSRRTRHPIVLASLWASILGTVALALIVGGPDGRQAGDTALMIGVCIGGGAIYGGTLGMTARLVQIGLRRWRQRPHLTEPSR